MKKTAASKQRNPRKEASGVKAKTMPNRAAGDDSGNRPATPAALLGETSRQHGVLPFTFEYFNPDAREVWLAGSFNGWHPQATPMARDARGRWSVELSLAPGSHEYRLIVDGQWQDDPMASRFVTNSFGGLNSVVDIEPAEGLDGLERILARAEPACDEL